MTIQVTGILHDPMNNVSAGTIIRITAVDTTQTIKGMVASTETDVVGGYTFNLVEGTHRIELRFSDEYSLVEDVKVDGTTPSPISLVNLLVNHTA